MCISPIFFQLLKTEKRLHSMNQLVEHPNSVQYFWPDRPVGRILDDHIPFLSRGLYHLYQNHHASLLVYSLSSVFILPPPFLLQVLGFFTSYLTPSHLCGTRLMIMKHTLTAPQFRTWTRSFRFLFWNTSTPDPAFLRTHKMPHNPSSSFYHWDVKLFIWKNALY